MATSTAAVESEADRMRHMEAWFQRKAEALIERASHGFFTKSIDASEVRAEFRNMAEELGHNRMRLLREWFDLRAEVFIRKAAHGWSTITIDVEDVRSEFKILAIEYSRLAPTLESIGPSRNLP